MANDNDPAEWRRMASAWIALLREQASKPVTRIPMPQQSIVLSYPTFKDGSAFHTQDSGWRMAADILFEQIVARHTPRIGRSDVETQLHAEFDSLITRQIGYAYLASWRLSLEIALKVAIADMHSATEVPIPSMLRHLLRGHEIAGLWRRLLDIMPTMRTALRDMAIECEIDPGKPGLALDTPSHQSAIDLIVSIDPDGQSLRYRENLGGDPNMGAVTRVDIAQSQAMFTNLFDFLQACSSLAASVQQIRECRVTALQREQNWDSPATE